MKKHLLFLSLILSVMFPVSAETFRADGLRYEIISSSSRTVRVTYESSIASSNKDYVSGDLSIPAEVARRVNGLSYTYSVVSIGKSAFSGCTGLTSVTLPDNITLIDDFAFKDCSELTTINIPNGVTSIGTSAFMGCAALTYVSIPNGITAINRSVFNGCASLRSIQIPNKVTSIDDYAFSGCADLMSVTIGSSVASIGKSAFRGCANLASITIPNSVTSIGETVFENCSLLNTVNLSNRITTIGKSMFHNCWNLNSIYLPNSVILIDDNAFEECTGLNSITIPNGVTTIGNSAFSGCMALFSINIPNKTTTIGEKAFSGCTGLTSITIPSGVTSIGGNAFDGASITSVTIEDGKATLKMGNGDSNDVDVFKDCPLRNLYLGRNLSYDSTHSPFRNKTSLTSLTIGDGVTSIGGSAFYGCTGLQIVNIPNMVTSIGNFAFSGCTDLSSVTIGKGVASIGQAAFGNCKKLISLTIPDNVITIGPSIFNGCSNLKSVSLSNGVASIGGYAFKDCASLTAISIPGSTTSIGEKAFEGCTSLASVTFEDGKSELRLGAGNSNDKDLFKNCPLQEIYMGRELSYYSEYNGSYDTSPFAAKTKLKTLTIGASVTSISNLNFIYCTSLSTFIINDSETALEGRGFGFQKCPFQKVYLGRNLSYHTSQNSPFWGKETLTDVTIGDCVTRIPDHCFSYCRGLKTISIPDNIKYFSGFDYCSGLTSITIPENVTEIGHEAFYGCKGLTSITIPDNVTEIGSYAFYGCTGLTSVSIPQNVTKINEKAFYDCTQLTKVYSLNPQPPTLWYNSFSDETYNNTILTVPQGCKNLYRDKEIGKNWHKFLNIKEIGATGVEKVNGNPISIKVVDNQIVMDGVIDGLPIEVYDINGRLVCRRDSAPLTLAKSGTYIVRVGTYTARVFVR